MSCSLTRSAGSKDGVVGGLLHLFSNENRWSVAGEPAVPTTDVLTLLAQLPREFPRGKYLQHGTLEEAFKICAARRGEDLDLARPITRNAKGSSRPPSCAFTASEITAFLWDQIVFELIKQIAFRPLKISNEHMKLQVVTILFFIALHIVQMRFFNEYNENIGLTA